MTKELGVPRFIDPLGRVVVPKEYRDAFGLQEDTPVHIRATTDGQIIIERYTPEDQTLSVQSAADILKEMTKQYQWSETFINQFKAEVTKRFPLAYKRLK